MTRGVSREEDFRSPLRLGDAVDAGSAIPSQTDPRTGHIAFPDAFRAIAIAAVFTAHLGAYGTTGTYFTFLGTWGADCFFVLSGFLLSGPYLRAALDAQPVPSSRAFWMRRFLRIYPLYAVCVLLSVLPALSHHGVSLANILTHLTLTHGFFVGYADASFNGPLWTMAVDAQFYLLLPIVGLAVIAICRNRGQAWRRRAVWAAIATAVVISIVERAIAFRHIPNASENFGATVVYARNVIGMASAFAFGVAITYVNKLFGRPTLYAATATTIAGLSLLLLLIASRGENSNVMVVQVFYDLIGALSGAALLYGLGEGPFPAVQRITSLPFIAGAASLAYGVYLFHKPVSFLSARLLGSHVHHGTPIYGLSMLVLTLPVVIVIAYLGNRFVEEPFLRMKDRFREKPIHTV